MRFDRARPSPTLLERTQMPQTACTTALPHLVPLCVKAGAVSLLWSAPALVAVKVVRPVGRSTLTPLSGAIHRNLALQQRKVPRRPLALQVQLSMRTRTILAGTAAMWA